MSNEPHVSGHDLRAALATHGRSRPNPLMSDGPAWEWTTDEQAELDELRASTRALEDQVEQLRGAAADARGRERQVRDALRRVAEARPWRRRALIRELSAGGLL